MWNLIKRWFSTNTTPEISSDQTEEYEFKWYAVGDSNPFPMPILDVRSLTWSVVATTEDPRISDLFSKQRLSDGREHIKSQIENSSTIQCNLVFPHNGDNLEGVVYKSESMDVKWDIYIYDSVFLFVRSWTGQLVYRAHANLTETEIQIHSLEASADQLELAPQSVYFILGTHSMGRVLPHSIPKDLPNDPKEIALLSFSMYGNLGCYATYDDITQIEVPRPSEESEP